MRMGTRRMFTKKITDDDRFVTLPSSAQALYLHLSMSADDDGFSNEVSASMFKAHATTADLEMLLERKYLYQFDDGVIVIKHWRIHNYIRNDRKQQGKRRQNCRLPTATLKTGKSHHSRRQRG